MLVDKESHDSIVLAKVINSEIKHVFECNEDDYYIYMIDTSSFIDIYYCVILISYPLLCCSFICDPLWWQLEEIVKVINTGSRRKSTNNLEKRKNTRLPPRLFLNFPTLRQFNSNNLFVLIFCFSESKQ